MTLLLIAGSFLLSLLITYIVKITAEKLNFYDRPKNDLKDHSHPVPYTGLAIWITFTIILIIVRFTTNYDTGTLHQLRGIVYGSIVMIVLGFLDDIFDLDFKVKFFWQIIASFILIHYDIYIKLFPVDYLNVAVSLFWVIFVTNAINIIDVMDGLSVGTSAICALSFFAVTLPTEMTYVNIASIILFGTLSGFWFYNKPKAKVFMGDAGSLFVGFLLAAISMGAGYSKNNMIGLFAPFLILGIPIYDTLLVSYFRWRRGQPIFKGSKDHYALRLSTIGLNSWQIDIISYVISLILGLSAFLITVLSAGYSFLVLIIIFAGGLLGSAYLDTIDPHK